MKTELEEPVKEQGLLASIRRYFKSEKSITSISAAAGVAALSSAIADLVMMARQLPPEYWDIGLKIGISIAAVVVAALVYRSKGD